jgi:hypothetical protein
VTPGELRQAVCNVASSEESSVDAAKYWREVLPSNWQGPYPRHWCGAFALYCLRKVLGCTWHWEVGKGFLFRLRPTSAPQIGDICYQASPYQHHAVLTAIGTEADNTPYTITQDGNQGMTPGICLEQYRKHPKWSAIYSIEPLIRGEP